MEAIIKSNTKLLQAFISKASYNTALYEKMMQSKAFSNEHRQFNISENYLKMRELIKAENNLLYSYNINVERDNKAQVSKTARYCGLSI